MYICINDVSFCVRVRACALFILKLLPNDVVRPEGASGRSFTIYIINHPTTHDYPISTYTDFICVYGCMDMYIYMCVFFSFILLWAKNEKNKRKKKNWTNKIPNGMKVHCLNGIDSRGDTWVCSSLQYSLTYT